VTVMEIRDMELVDIGVYKIRDKRARPGDNMEDVGIIEQCTVLQDLQDVPTGCALLFGLLFIMNLSYPKKLRYTLEFYQKVLMGLDGKRLKQ
ncbi:hypothetical protein NL108_012173, partial [Boleophthalmus pectinirostris]